MAVRPSIKDFLWMVLGAILLLAGSNFPVALLLLASIHVLLHKRDSRATTLWLATIWFLPLLGPILYVALGINRIRRRAISLATPGDNREFTLPASSVPTCSCETARWWASRRVVRLRRLGL